MEQKDHSCVLCKKSFSCGKALGGHISSAHVQPSKDYSKKLKNSKKKNNNTHHGDDEEEENDDDESIKIFSCQVCEKEFDTVKSLSGHMRCHPDRDWRGVEAPTQPPVVIIDKPHDDDDDSESDSDVDDDDDDDSQEEEEEDDDDGGVINGRRRWGNSGKRGRVGSIVHIPYSSMQEDDNREVMSAACLLMCVNKSWIPSGKNPFVEYASMCSNSLASNSSTRDYDDDDDSFKETAKAFLEIHNKGLENPSIDDHNETKTKTLDNKKKGKKKMVLQVVKEEPEELDLVRSPPKIYKCTQCPNVYTCYQALGGHMSTHPKFHETAASCSGNGKGNSQREISSSSDHQKLHQCEICNQIFFSGQALGGHKRCHQRNSTSRKVLTIDLNEPPNDSVEDK